MAEMKLVKMLSNDEASVDGLNIEQYEKNKTYLVPYWIRDSFVDLRKTAEDTTEESLDAEEKAAAKAAADRTQDAKPPEEPPKPGPSIPDKTKK